MAASAMMSGDGGELEFSPNGVLVSCGVRWKNGGAREVVVAAAD
jgi:hypothetical protein